MLKGLLRLALLLSCLGPTLGLAQTLTFPALSTDNVFTGKDQFAIGARVGPVTFATLPASPTDGTLIYCSDCVQENPCAASGTGAFAQRTNGAWNCTAAGVITGTPTSGTQVVGNGTTAVYQSKPRIDVRDFFVTGNGVTDDTTNFQNAVNAACVALPAISGTLIIPNNFAIKLTSTISFTNCGGFMLDGGQAQGQSTVKAAGGAGSGNAAFLWYGSAGGTVLKVNQVRDSIFQHFTIFTNASSYTASGANVGLLIDKIAPFVGIVTNNDFQDIQVYNGNAANSSFIAISICPTGVGNCEQQNFTRVNITCGFASPVTSSNTGVGIKLGPGGQPYDEHWREINTKYCSQGMWMQVGAFGGLDIDGGLADHNYTDLYLYAGSQISYKHTRSEFGTAQIILDPFGANVQDLTVEGNFFAGLTTATTTINVIDSTAGTTIRNIKNQWDQLAGVTPIHGPGGGSGTLDSQDNIYPGTCPNYAEFGAGGSSFNDLFPCSNQQGVYGAKLGIFHALSIIQTNLTPGTSPICPNGTGGAFTTSGCAGGLTPAWSSITPATTHLTLANTSWNTTISNTASTNFIVHSNVTPATNLGVNQSSPTFNECGTYFTLGASAADCWNMQTVISASATSTTVTNVSESAGNVVTLTITGGTLLAGQTATFTGLTTATWLNSQNATLITATSTSLTFTDPTSHGVQGSAAETGRVTQANPLSTLVVAHSGSGNGASQTMFQAGENTFGGVTYPSMNIGALSVPGTICSTTGAGNYGTGYPGYGYAVHDICPTLFTAPPPLVTGSTSRSIMGMNAGLAIAFNAAYNVFAINGQLASPTSYTGNIGGGWYGMYHETDFNHTGNTNISYGIFGATYNNSVGTCAQCIGGHFEAIGNFYGGANAAITTTANALEAMSGVKAGATHTNDVTIKVLTPVTGGTFSNAHIGLKIEDQTVGGVLSNAVALQIGAGGNVTSGAVDLGANNVTVESTGSGYVSLNHPTTVIGTVNVSYPLVSGRMLADGWTCRITTDVSLTVNVANSFCLFTLPAGTGARSWHCDILWSITAGSGTNTFSLGVNPSQTPTGATRAAARIDTTQAGTYTENTAALSASGALNVLTSPTYTPAATVQRADASGTILASATAGTFAITATAAGTTATSAISTGSSCQLQ